MKLCIHCGQELEDDAVVCSHCGQAQESEAEDDSYEEISESEQEEQTDEFIQEDEEFDDFEDSGRKKSKPQVNIMDTINRYYQILTGKDDTPHLWQLGIVCACILGAILFMISACLGSVFSLIGIPACLIFGYFTLKKPKFNAVAMLVPILLFALMLTSMAGSFHGFMDSSMHYTSAAQSAGNEEQLKLANKVMAVFGNYFARFSSADDYSEIRALGTDSQAAMNTPVNTGAVIFRILVYAMAAIYLLAQLGKLRSVVISTYSMVVISAACAIYYFIRMFVSIGGGMVLFNLAAFLFMAAWGVFVFFSEKMSENKKSRVLHRFFRVTPAAPRQMGKTVSVLRIVSLALAGVLALVGVYVLVISIVTIVRMGKNDGGEYIFRYILITLFQLCLLLGGGFMYWHLAMKLEKRDDSFLKHYLILGLYSVCLVFVLCSTPVISGWGLVGLTALALALYTAGAVYLARSNEIKEYYVSDKYITQCTLLKKLPIAK